jgi:PEP-CTERM motif-containing protein
MTMAPSEAFPGIWDHFLDGSAQGQITTGSDFLFRQPSLTYDRLVFTFDDGVPVPPAPTPEPGSLLLLATGILAGARHLKRPLEFGANGFRRAAT